MKWLLSLAIFLVIGYAASSNNVSIPGAATLNLSNINNNVVTVSFTLSWENSWRDNINWDAVYLFMKFKAGSPPYEWHHCYLNKTGHTVGSSILEFVPAESGEGVTGVFLQRNTAGKGNIGATAINLVWNLNSTEYPVRKQDLLDGKVEVSVQAIEMVYVPAGSFYVGDGVSTGTLGGSKPQIVNCNTTTYGANFPTGFNAFYCMKYELSQEQYVNFLNKLTYAQQLVLLPNLGNYATGTYISRGKVNDVAYGNGIIVSQPSVSGRPVVFANNYSNNTTYNATNDGQAKACNYLSPKDLITYCAWSGLRPMSETEYEKACRGALPNTPSPGEYAWGTSSDLEVIASVGNIGLVTERANIGNVNCGNTLGIAQVSRCGIFAEPGTTRIQAGASYWGILDLTGNVYEMCYIINSAFTGTHGSGVWQEAVAGWPANYSGVIIRGGGWSDSKSLQTLRVSYRNTSQIGATARSQHYGFRAVHTAPVLNWVSNAGSISCQNGQQTDNGYVGKKYGVWSVTDAQFGPMDVYYEWYYRVGSGAWTVVAGENYASLVFTGFSAAGTYQFMRKAFCAQPMDSNIVTVTVTNP